MNLIDQINNQGYAISHVCDFLSNESQTKYNKALSFFDHFLTDPNCLRLIRTLRNEQDVNKLKGIVGKKKFYELTHYQLLRRGLGLEDYDLINLYLSDAFVNLAKRYYQSDNIKLFNILFWVHPVTAVQTRNASQNWHRDKEDVKNLKVFIYFNDVDENNGALEYIPNSFARNKEDLSKKEYNEKKSVMLKGKAGSIIFVNTTGFHRGGFINSGMRLVSHALYLKSDALMIRNGYFNSFNYNPEINDVNLGKLSHKQKHLLI